jgi:hypothetical protein
MTFDLRWPAFFTRVTAGLLFAMAGVHKVFIMTPQVHTRKLFLEPYQHIWIPHFLLWSLGLGIPFVELIAGWLLVAGFLRRPSRSASVFCFSRYVRDATAATLRFSSPGRWYATSVSLPLLGRSFGTMTQLEQTSERLRRVFCADRKLLVVTCSHGDVYREGLYDIDKCQIVAM